MEGLTDMEALPAISTDDARALLATQDLIAVGIQGDEVRRAIHGTITMFGRVLEVHVDAIPSALPSGEAAGEVRIVGRPSSEAAAVAAVEAMERLGEGRPGKSEPRRPLTGFSLADLRALVPSVAELKKLCRKLRGRGLEAVAEAPLDLLEDPAETIEAAREGQLAVWRLTVNALPPGPPDADQRIALVERARDLQKAVGGLRAFAPLPRSWSVSMPTTGYDDLKLVSLARVVVTNIRHIQVDWPLYGPKLAQVALTMGADDVDGIVAVDTAALGPRRSPFEEIKSNIRAAGLEAFERDGRLCWLSNIPLT
jgi:hypothetical protein